MPGFWDDIQLYAKSLRPELPSEDESDRILKGETIDMLREKHQEALVRSSQPARGTEEWARQTMRAIPTDWNSLRPEEIKVGSPDPYLERRNEAVSILENADFADRAVRDAQRDPVESPSRLDALRVLGRASMGDDIYQKNRPVVIPAGPEYVSASGDIVAGKVRR